MIVPLVRDRLHYAWIVMGVTFLILLTSAGVRSVPGILIVPLETEFGWDRATISLAVSLNLLLFGLYGPFAAALMDRFGMQRMVVLALTLLAVAVGLTPLMQSSWQLVALWGVLAGIGSGAMAGGLAAGIAFAAGAMHSWFGNYELAFMTSGFLCLVAATIVLRIGRPSTGTATPLPVTAPAGAPAS